MSYSKDLFIDEAKAALSSKFGGNLGNGSGGVSSWNDLTDKPFGEVPPAFDIQWDGDMTGRFALDMSMLGYAQGVYFVKVSDIVPTAEELIGSLGYENTTENPDCIRDDTIDSTTYPGSYNIANYIVIVYDQTTLNSALGLPDGYVTNGVYFIRDDTTGLYFTRLTAQTKIIKLDEKFLPDTVAKTTDLTGYAKTTDLASYAKTTDLTGYAKTTDLAGYAKTTDLAGYQTEAQVNALINNALGVIANGTY